MGNRRARHGIGVDSLALLPWRPGEFQRHLDEWPDELVIVGTVATTRAGDQGVIYRTTSDQGLVGWVEFLSGASRHDDLGFAAWALVSPLATPVPRAQLLDLDASVFMRLRGRRRVGPPLSERLVELAGSRVGEASRRATLPELDVNDLEWVPAGSTLGWGVEASMSDAIASDRRAWRKLGYRTRPGREVMISGQLDRMDLHGESVVVESKLDAGTTTLVQLDRYLAALRRSDPTVVGQIVVGRSFTQDLRDQVNARDDVGLWTCARSSDGHPELVRVA